MASRPGELDEIADQYRQIPDWAERYGKGELFPESVRRQIVPCKEERRFWNEVRAQTGRGGRFRIRAVAVDTTKGEWHVFETFGTFKRDARSAWKLEVTEWRSISRGVLK